MSYYQFNRQEILQKAKKNYSKEKAAEYYLLNKEAIKKNTKNRYKNMTDKEKKQKKNIKKVITRNERLIKMTYCWKKQIRGKKWLIITKKEMSAKTCQK